jgi:hypothetical protein
MTDEKLARLVAEALEKLDDLSSKDLEAAPLIEDWLVVGAIAPCLVAA